MSDKQQVSLHKWEIVSQGGQGENATTYRMRVPGGCCTATSRTSRARPRAWRSCLIRPCPE
jgi:hypothetical protein